MPKFATSTPRVSPIVIEKDSNGRWSASWASQPGDQYRITGEDRNGKRFAYNVRSWAQAEGVNLWRGTKWLVRGGQKYKITSAFN